ncbi:MAG TPA: hypothetical protein VGF94_05030 [Kofleriaceae bacterium]|jgi:hypothetical protein
MRAALVVILLVAGTSYADPPRYRRPARVPPAPVARPRPSKRALPDAPATAEQVMAVELTTEPIRDAQTKLLGKLVRDTPDSDPDKPEYLFRLAETFARQSRLFRLQAIGLELSANHHD